MINIRFPMSNKFQSPDIEILEIWHSSIRILFGIWVLEFVIKDIILKFHRPILVKTLL